MNWKSAFASLLITAAIGFGLTNAQDAPAPGTDAAAEEGDFLEGTVWSYQENRISNHPDNQYAWNNETASVTMRLNFTEAMGKPLSYGPVTLLSATTNKDQDLTEFESWQREDFQKFDDHMDDVPKGTAQLDFDIGMPRRSALTATVTGETVIRFASDASTKTVADFFTKQSEDSDVEIFSDKDVGFMISLASAEDAGDSVKVYISGNFGNVAEVYLVNADGEKYDDFSTSWGEDWERDNTYYYDFSYWGDDDEKPDFKSMGLRVKYYKTVKDEPVKFKIKPFKLP